MKTAAFLAAASILLASSAFAQSSAPPSNPPPPPGMNDPGTQPVAPSTEDSSANRSQAGRHATVPAMQAPAGVHDGKHMTLPAQVSVRREGENDVQEYRRSGLLYMVVVTPKGGVPQTYMVDPDGTRHFQAGEPPVRPVMYKVLEWGKSKPANAESTEAAAGDDGH